MYVTLLKANAIYTTLFLKPTAETKERESWVTFKNERQKPRGPLKQGGAIYEYICNLVKFSILPNLSTLG